MDMPSHASADPHGPAIPLRLRPADVRALLGSSMVVMRSQAAAIDVSLTVSVADDVPGVLRLDPGKIGWAITSLVGNALRYVRRGSRHTPGGTIAVAVTYDRAQPAIVIEVRDDGPGIVPATASRLFNHDDPHGPSGLGLLLVYDIVVAHGGTVEVRSPVEPTANGTSIRITLPTG
jgi:signal transduction histidine kinase